MSNLISATLTPEAMLVYKEFERGTKSKVISDLLVTDLDKQKKHEAMIKQINAKNIAIARVIWELNDNPIHRSLCTDLNELLLNTIHYHYWD